jgi:malic enzyme
MQPSPKSQTTQTIAEQIFSRGLMEISCRFPPKDKTTLAMVYTPGVGQVCMAIKSSPELVYTLTNKLNTMFVISNGSTLGRFAEVDPVLKKEPSLQKKYTQVFQKNELKDTRFVLPLVEYHSYLYKAIMNIDAYPLVFNNLIDSPEKLLLCLESIATTTQCVELMSVQKSFYEPIIDQMQKLPLVIVLPSHRRFLRKALASFSNVKFSKQYLINLIISLVVKFKMHSKSFGLIDTNDLKDIATLLKTNDFFGSNILEIMTQSFRVLQKHCKEGADCLFISNDFVLTNELYKGKNFSQESIFYRIFRDHSNKDNSIKIHEHFKGMIESKELLRSADLNNLTLLLTSAVVKRYCLSLLTREDPLKIRKGTISRNYCAIITDGTAILGYGDIGSKAGLPVMEGKICLFKELGDVNVIPFSLASGLDLAQMKLIIKGFSDSWSAINLEDIAAPLCFDLEMQLNEELPIPVFHDDQHGTAIVVLAGLINALKVVGKSEKECSMVINGAGAAGMAICKLLMFYGFNDITLVDSKGAIYEGRPDLPSNKYKLAMSKKTNLSKKQGKLGEIIKQKDIFIGVSKGNVLSKEMVQTMKDKPIVFALANPTPEIHPSLAKEGGAYVVATGRSDFVNQINNSLVFPGIFRGLIDSFRRDVDLELKAKAAIALASVIEKPSPEMIIPASLNSDISKIIAQKVHSMTMTQKL